MLSKLSEIKERAENTARGRQFGKLNELRVKTLGRKGEITVISKPEDLVRK